MVIKGGDVELCGCNDVGDIVSQALLIVRWKSRRLWHDEEESSQLTRQSQCLGDDVSDVVTPTNAFSLSCHYTLALATCNDVGDVVSHALLLALLDV